MLENSQNRMIELLQYNIFTHEDQIENAKLFHWAEKIPVIYNEHLVIIEDKRQLFIKSLHVIHIRFLFYKFLLNVLF